MIGKMNTQPTPANNTQMNQYAMEANASIKNTVESKNASGIQNKKVETSQNEYDYDDCETCKNRRYQDGSNDSGVSFQVPTKMSPGIAATAVASHEREHVAHNAAQAARDGNDILESTVQIFTGVCPECGRSYISGGETRTKTRINSAEIKTVVSPPSDQNAKKSFDLKL